MKLNSRVKVSKLLRKVTDKSWILFVLILLVGLYLRFYNIESTISFGWDQGRDAWLVRDILNGQLILTGPRTGVGHMHLGPVYYYLLAPFFFFTQMDPMASNYFNILANIFNFAVIFYVTNKLFGKYAALFVLLIYSTSNYLITLNQVPWNVTTMPGFAVLIFYAITQIYEGKYRWVFVLWALSGFYFNLHFTAVFLPVINIVSLIFVKDKKRVILYSLYSIPLYLIWFVPNIIHGLLNKGGDYNTLHDFFRYYYIGFHFRFFLHRIHDALIMFNRVLYYPAFLPLVYLLPSIFAVLVLLEKDKKKRLLGYLCALWFIVPWVGFTLYGGPLSEYYFLYNAPIVLFVFVYLQQKLLSVIGTKRLPILILLAAFWGFYIYQNTHNLWIKSTSGGLTQQKQQVKTAISKGEVLKYNEGDIKVYLYEIWVKDKKPY